MYSQIIEFFEKRKLESLLSCSTFEDKVSTVRQHLKGWLAETAKKVGQMKLSTHPCTFVHPGAKNNVVLLSQISAKGKTKIVKEKITTTPINADIQRSNDGFIRSGNVAGVECDALGNAAVLGYFSFLNVLLPDGKTILWHVEQDTDEAKELLSNCSSLTFDQLKAGILAVKNYDGKLSTSSKLKQVYFPVNGDYHLLSVLMPSGIMFEMCQRIRNIKFSEETKNLKEAKKKNEFRSTSFKDIADLTVVGFGGTKPQNISFMNNSNGGKSYYLPSFPPELSDYRVRLPSRNFFTEILWPGFYKEEFTSLHRLFKADANNKAIRQARDNIILDIFDDIVRKIWRIRSSEKGWSTKERCAGLPEYQRIILDDLHVVIRANADDMIHDFLRDISRWLIKAYLKTAGSDAIMLGDDELIYIEKLMEGRSEVLR